MRISARLDEERSQRLEFLSRVTHQGTTEVVKQAIDRYYAEVQCARTRPVEIFEATRFIGSGEGPEDLSSRYKEYLVESLAGKHGHR